jgi:ferrochelatase
MNKKVVLLINLGTPDSPKTSDVRKYLSEFLNDPRVIDIPWLARKILVNLIIVPFRAPKSAKIYEELWDEKGSPLLYHGVSMQQKLQNKLGDDYQVEFAMRYQNPHMKDVLEKIRKSNPREIIALPLYPQYASSTTGSTVEYLMKVMSQWYVIPQLKVLGQFYQKPKFIEAVSELARRKDLTVYDHFLFSYHGLPVRQVDKVYDEGLCEDHNCEEAITEQNTHCYKATCYETTRLIQQELNLDEKKCSVAFQSRLDKNWLEPFADKELMRLAKAGNKNILVFSPSFVADCLETTIEIGSEYKELFEEAGGKQLDLVEGLNDSDLWIEALQDMVENAAQ